MKKLTIAILCFSASLLFTNETLSQEVCSGNTFDNGVVGLVVSSSSNHRFFASLLGTFDQRSDGSVVGGLDWFFSNTPSKAKPANQLIGWWSKDNERNSLIQVSNNNNEFGLITTLKIEFINENCEKVAEFCDPYTVFDTHVYDLDNLTLNDGSVPTPLPENTEGIVVVTPVTDACDTDTGVSVPIAYPYLTGNMTIVDNKNGFNYRENLFHRGAETAECLNSGTPPRIIISGELDCNFDPVRAVLSPLSKTFTQADITNNSRADLVTISLSDIYDEDGNYTPNAFPFVNIFPFIVDEDENALECAEIEGCFFRLGINDTIPNSNLDLPPVIFSDICDTTDPAAIIGTAGNDTINGTSGDDIIFGLDGNDTINGRGGNDCIDGGEGNDTINGNGGNDLIAGETGNDILRGGNGDDNIRGNEGDDNIRGNSGNDTIRGGRGEDTIRGGQGEDFIRGGRGADDIRGNADNDDIRGNGGDDTLRGNSGDDFINGGNGFDFIRGGSGTDECINGENVAQCEL